ncbi:MAG TPA: hypothetical protein VFO85_16200, partial [Vicinamibacteria bacterium]|nr:hypothetical protein [Vicinamibacteria bacterium]
MRPRFWPALLVVSAAAAWLVYVWAVADAIRQWKMVQTLSTLALAAAALTLWLALLSRLPTRVRWGGAAAIALGAALFFAAFRARGVTGDLVPVFEPRWSRAPEAARTASPPAGAHAPARVAAPSGAPSPAGSEAAAPAPPAAT